MQRTYKNPILKGFYPDPSICRAGEDYYLITSTFEYFPGLPIFHSKDLVNWKQIGHVLDRPSQLPLDGIKPSDGLFAPTIRYNNGIFYVINTLVGGKSKSGNFIVTATDPHGPWSEPYWLDNAPGVDPSLLFDDDGRVWCVGQRSPEPCLYWGHSEVWLQEIDIKKMMMIGDKYQVWSGALHNTHWVEGPHVYKINDTYYLFASEGGTGHDHAVTVARSKSIIGPYEGYDRNPILTHRQLGWNYPITSTGHSDLVQTQNGEWWMVHLATRPYGGYYYNLGRETYLVPVTWEDGWPLVSPGTGRVEWEYQAPDLPQYRFPSEPVCDHFDSKKLSFNWHFLRTPRENFVNLEDRNSFLRLKLSPGTVCQQINPSLICRRQQHIDFSVRTKMEFKPSSSSECAGLVLLQNNDFHFRFVVTLVNNIKVIQLWQRKAGTDSLLSEITFDTEIQFLKVEAIGQEYNFYNAILPEEWIPVAEKIDGRILSTNIAGGFVGAMIGLYASSNGNVSSNFADFDWFEYYGY